MSEQFDNNEMLENVTPENENAEEAAINTDAVDESPEASAEAAPEKPKKKAKLMLPILIAAAAILVAVIIIIGVAIYNVFSKPDPDVQNLFNEKLLCVKDGDKWGYVNKRGKCVIKAKYDKAYNFTENGLARVGQYNEEDGVFYYGFINKKGDTVVKAKYMYATDFYECGLAAVVDEDGEWGVIDAKGELVVKCKYEKIFIYDSGVIIAETSKGKVFLVDKKGEDISEKYEKIDWYEEAEIGVVYDDDEVGIINAKGKEILELTDDYDAISNFNENGIGLYWEDDYYGIINSKGKVITKADYEYIFGFNKNNLAVFVNEDDEYGILNSKGKVIVEAGKYGDIEQIEDGWFMAVDEDEETAYILNERGKEVFSFEEDGDWYMINDFADNGLAPVVDEDEYIGFINRKGKLVIDCDYYDANSFSSCGLARVIKEEGDEFTFINERGKVVGDSYVYATDYFDDGYAVVAEVDGSEIIYKIINEKGRVVCELDCDDVLLPTGKGVLSEAIKYVVECDDFDKKEFLFNYIEENMDEDDIGVGFDNVTEYAEFIIKYLDDDGIDRMIISIVNGDNYLG